MPETTSTPITLDKFVDDFKVGLNNRHENQLGNSVTLFDDETIVTTVPAGNKQLALVI